MVQRRELRNERNVVTRINLNQETIIVFNFYHRSSTRDSFIDGDTFGGGMDMGHHARNESACSRQSNNSSTPSILRLYSLKTHRIVKEFPVFMDDTEEEMSITSIQSNDTAIIIVSCYYIVFVNHERERELEGKKKEQELTRLLLLSLL